MSESSSTADVTLSTQAYQTRDQFEIAWHAAHAGGQRPRIEDYLGLATPEERSALLSRLIRIDVDQRRRAGEQPRADDYLTRFPELGAAFLSTLLSQTTPSLRCPNCHSPIPLADRRLSEVLCPASGSTFRVAGSRLGTAQGEIRQLGKFQLLERVGLGAFGAVWKARDTELDRLVALKIPHPGLLISTADRERFQREARAAAQLRHPGIVTVHEVATLEELSALVSDFIEGVTLRDYVQEQRLTFREAAELVAQVAEALDYAHTMGVIHRDVKPGNILLAANPKSEIRNPKSEEPNLKPEGTASLPGTVPDSDFGFRISDFSPTITDFGLALRADADVTLTVEGQILGTPAYMSPEQAAGHGHRVDRRSDVYSLGMVLYELLTGAPPFRGSKTMLVNQVLHEEPRAPRKLNEKVPRDLETVCLKAMAKEPSRRYATARELADDLRRWLRGEPVQARPAGWLERAWRWCRRNPARAALAASLLALVLLVAGFAWWLTYQAAVQRLEDERREQAQRLEDERREQELRQAVKTAFERADDRQQRAEWSEARTLLEQTLERVGMDGPVDLRQQVSERLRLLKFVADLEDIRERKMILVEGKFDPSRADPEYRAAFQDFFGPGAFEEAPAKLAKQLRALPIRDQVVAALDDWAGAVKEKGQERLLEVARLADPDPLWRDRFRDPKVWNDRQALEELAARAEVQRLSPQLLTALGKRVAAARGNAVPLLRAAQARHPADFWLSFHLANALRAAKSDEAVGYYRVALALRPDSVAVLNNLGLALAALGRLDDALAVYDQALKLDPNFALVHTNRGKALLAKNRPDDALAAYALALKLDPKLPQAHTGRGVALQKKKLLDKAIAAHELALKFDPEFAQAHYNHGLALRASGRLDDAIAAYKRAIACDPEFAQAHTNLGTALHAQGRLDEAIAAHNQAIFHNPKLPQAHTNLGSALHARGQRDKAIAACQEALKLDPKLPQAHGTLGLAYLQTGRLEEALLSMRRVLDLLPPTDAYHKTVSQRLQTCERLLKLEPQLPALLRDEVKPRDNAERLDVAQLCSFQQRHHDAVRFYAEAFAAKPASAASRNPSHRFDAARAAVLAAAGKGVEPTSADAERSRLRRQALDWLRAELSVWGKVVEQGTNLLSAQQALNTWKSHADLASVRDADALERLPEAERAAWRQLWADVDTLLARFDSKKATGGAPGLSAAP